MKPQLSIRYLPKDSKDTIFRCFIGGTGISRSHAEAITNYDEVLDAWELLWATRTIDKHLVKKAVLVEGGSFNGRQTLFGKDQHSWDETKPVVPLGGNDELVLGPYWAGPPPPPPEEAPQELTLGISPEELNVPMEV